MAKAGIIGEGSVGTALKEGLTRGGHEVRTAGNDAKTVKDVGTWADTIILAVPFGERDNVLRELGEIDGKTIIDVTNALDADMGFAVDLQKESGAEELQRLAKGTKVVKAFNTVFAQHMDTGQLNGEPLTVLVAGDDEGAKNHTITLARSIGFDAIDAGPLENARWLEALGYLNVQLGFVVGHGTDIGFKLIHSKSAKAETTAASTQGT